MPDELDNPLLLSEYANCKNVFNIMEERGLYKDVKIIYEKPYCVDKDDEPEFYNMVLVYWHKIKDDDYIAELSSFYLRSSFGYFHKIRFSDVEEKPENNIPYMKFFLKTWNEFIKNLDLNSK